MWHDIKISSHGSHGSKQQRPEILCQHDALVDWSFAAQSLLLRKVRQDINATFNFAS